MEACRGVGRIVAGFVLAAGLGACASAPEGLRHGDGSYYAGAGDGRGDYYVGRSYDNVRYVGDPFFDDFYWLHGGGWYDGWYGSPFYTAMAAIARCAIATVRPAAGAGPTRSLATTSSCSSATRGATTPDARAMAGTTRARTSVGGRARGRRRPRATMQMPATPWHPGIPGRRAAPRSAHHGARATPRRPTA